MRQINYFSRQKVSETGDNSIFAYGDRLLEYQSSLDSLLYVPESLRLRRERIFCPSRVQRTEKDQSSVQS